MCVQKNEKLKPFIGMVEILEFASGKKLHLTMPHKPEDARMSFTIESLFEPYLNKKIKIIIEEQEGSGDF